MTDIFHRARLVRALTTAGIALLLAGAVRAGNQFYRLNGDDAAIAMGTAVAGTGDLDGDGVDDFVVGAPGGNPGIVRVHSGRTGAILREWTGEWGFGRSVAGDGDFDNDGVSDVLVGGRGNVYVFSGRTGAEMVDEQYASASFGFAVAWVGDINGDQYDDFVVGAPDATDQGKTECGVARLYDAATESAIFEWAGKSSHDHFGYALSRTGDVNDDDIPDVVIGAPDHQIQFLGSAGAVLVYSGSNGALINTILGQLSNPPGRFGAAVSGTLDFNQDGVNDLLVGAPWADGSAADSGLVSLYTTSGTLLEAYSVNDSGTQFGTSLAWVGDLDDDDTPDLLVGEPGAAGGTWPNIWSGAARVVSGASGLTLRQYHGLPLLSGSFGQSVAAAGDINHDGLTDLLIGDPDDGFDTGTAVVLTYRDYDASWSNYGTGLAGTLGVPALVLDHDPVLCDNFSFVLSNSLGAVTTGFLFVGFAEADLPTAFGSNLLVSFHWLFPLNISPAGLVLPVQLCDMTLTGLEIDLQLLELDPGAPKAVSFSPGLKIVLGL